MTGIQLKLAGVGKDKTAQVASLDCSVLDLRHSIAQSLGKSCKILLLMWYHWCRMAHCGIRLINCSWPVYSGMCSAHEGGC